MIIKQKQSRSYYIQRQKQIYKHLRNNFLQTSKSGNISKEAIQQTNH
ncbi:hypothetical protein BACCOP_03263 [Phocaeicola coprocola DSM 17136]|uniref:Uncharacterized protein n=1 Tax=Phocaeicola coprocola DSM 17136 TaxID=470145 RepID=B3JMV8_9BACT|nr:hypothetical protein BACCOP_03263 [Phocaeicola coprocola DSM 17136]